MLIRGASPAPPDGRQPPMDPDQLIAALSRPQAYPFAVGEVEVRQTPISILLFAGDRVYKVKKPVDMGFLDFTQPSRRLFYCNEEVRLNRRLAPDVYRGVTPVLGDGPREARFAPTGHDLDDAGVIDYAVEMRRLPDDRMLDRMLDAGTIDNGILDRLTEVLVRFHRSADTGPDVDEHGRPEAVARAVTDVLDRIHPHSPGLHRFLRERAARFLKGHAALLEQRVRQGWIRDGHGDLHAGNICLEDSGPVIYDCIEFSPALRCGDTVRDVAFLIMDLDFRGFRGFGGYLARRYAEAMGDASFDSLLPFYKAHLACVRGMVNGNAARDEAIGPQDRRAAADAARRYLHLAASYRLPPALVLLCGLPASGKSTAARHLARPFEAAVIRSDVVRKRLAGIPVTAHPTGPESEALYSQQSSRDTYATMLKEAQASLEAGRCVVVDATFARRADRDPFVRMAESVGAPWVVVHLDCTEETIARNLRSRAAASDEVSDADWQTYRLLKDRFEPPNEVGPDHLARSDGSDPLRLTSDLIDRLIGQSARVAES